MLKKNMLAVKILLDNTDANVNAKDDNGRTLIGLAIEGMTADSADLTLNLITDHNADPNLQDA